MAERIAKFIGNSGYCSRRKAEALIEQGLVSVNGKTIDTPATLVKPNDIIRVEGKVIKTIDKKRIWAMHKPIGVVCTKSDEKGRKTIYDLLPKTQEFQSLHYIGRLDINSEGLLLLTNSADLKRFYEHPDNKVERVYLVRVYGNLTGCKIFSHAERGFSIFDEKKNKKMTYHADIELYKPNTDGGKNSWLKFTLKEGKNREIRKICEKFSLEVSKLKRISFGKFNLDSLPRGEIIEK